MKRRHFITGVSSISAGLALGSPNRLMASSASTRSGDSSKPKKLLILGGSGFIGPPMVRYAVERGHEVTIFTRGKTAAELPDVEQLIGDRTGDLDALKGRHWDVVLDNNARDYRWVDLTTKLLRDQVAHASASSKGSRLSTSSLRYSRKGSISIESRTSPTNAEVSNCRASFWGMPRLRR